MPPEPPCARGVYLRDDILLTLQKFPTLIADLENRRGFVATKLAWTSGLMMLVRTSAVYTDWTRRQIFPR